MPFRVQLQNKFGNIDIYLFDQLLKGRFNHCANILDAGCGNGRNLVFFLQNGFNVFTIDHDRHAIEQVRKLAGKLAPKIPIDNFRVGTIEKIPYANAQFDAVICSAVLHFAKDDQHFKQMIQQMWHVLKTGGLFFTRLASTIGLENRVKHIQGRQYLLPDGSQRFLVDEAMLLEITTELGAILLDPIKTTNVQNIRCMTTWCLQKT